MVPKAVLGGMGLAVMLSIAGCPAVVEPLPLAALSVKTYVAQDGSVAVLPDISGSHGEKWALRWVLDEQSVPLQGKLPAGELPLVKGLPRTGILALTLKVIGWGASDETSLAVDLAKAAGQSPPVPPAPPSGEGWWMPYGGIIITIDGDGNVVNVGDGSADGGYFIFPPAENDDDGDNGNGGSDGFACSPATESTGIQVRVEVRLDGDVRLVRAWVEKDGKEFTEAYDGCEELISCFYSAVRVSDLFLVSAFPSAQATTDTKDPSWTDPAAGFISVGLKTDATNLTAKVKTEFLPTGNVRELTFTLQLPGM